VVGGTWAKLLDERDRSEAELTQYPLVFLSGLSLGAQKAHFYKGVLH
jgi:hypothetical protein